MTSVTAIVPTYNRAHTLPRALASVFGQSRPPDEVIVVDDGSTDDTAAVVRRFPEVRYVPLAGNGGAGRARNEGVRRARGALIAFLDSDDAWHRDKLQLQLAHLSEAPQVELLCTGITVHERSGATAIHSASGPGSTAAGWTFADFQAYPFCPSTWLIRASVFAQDGLFDEAMGNAEDLDFLARIARRRIALLPQALAAKYNQADSLDSRLEPTAESYRILFERHGHLWARAPAAAARSYRRLAYMYIGARRMAEARRALVSGLRHRPWDLRSWVLLAVSPLGPRAYAVLRRWRAL